MIVSGVETFMRSISTVAISDVAQLSLVLRFHIEVSGAQNGMTYVTTTLWTWALRSTIARPLAMASLEVHPDAMDVALPQSDNRSDAMDVDIASL